MEERDRALALQKLDDGRDRGDCLGEGGREARRPHGSGNEYGNDTEESAVQTETLAARSLNIPESGIPGTSLAPIVEPPVLRQEPTVQVTSEAP